MEKRKQRNTTLRIDHFLRSSLILFMCAIFYNANAQQKLVSGTIVDDINMPIPGASIVIQGTSTGTVADFDGVFTIEASVGDTLIFSFIGMKNKSILVDNNTQNISVILEYDNEALDEVIVVGYGTQKKSDVISSVTSVKPEEMLKVPTSDVGEMLRGKAAGVQVTLGDGGPGSSSNILIRGQNSISGGNNPIVIVDGVPVDNINDVNPNDIASLEILKDAAAQAIYGARASNGVILITTKRGKEGKMSISYDAAFGVQTINRTFDIYDGEEFAQLKREAFRTSNLGVYLPDEEVFTPLELASIQSGEFIDWEKEIIETGVTQNHNLSISSGTEKTKVYTAFNYFNQKGVVKNSDFNRITARINIDQKLNKWLNVGLNTSLQISEGNRPNVGNVILTAITTSPLGQIYNEDGSLRFLPGGLEENKNPLINLEETNTETNKTNNLFNIFVDVTPFKGFKYRLNASRRSWNQKSSSYNSTESLVGISSGGLANGSLTFEDNVEWQLENIITYDTDFNTDKKHKLNITAVQSVSQQEYYSFFNFANEIPNDILGIRAVATATTNSPEVSGFERGLFSVAGRMQYDYSSKYYVTVSGRTDASTVFGTNNKWSFFPATAVGWNAHKENFMENITAVNNLKLRLSYGSVGNQGIDPYQSIASAQLREYVSDGTKITGYAPDNFLSNPDLKWETSTTFNAAIDVGLWNNRVTSTIEFYNTKTKDLLVTESIPAITGYSNRWTNIGKVQNQGIEVALNTAIVRNQDFKFNLGLNFTRNVNKILELRDVDGDGIGDDDVSNNWFIGQPINVYYRNNPIGIFQEGEDIISTHQSGAQPGDVKLFDSNPDDGELNASDRVITQATPDWFGTLNINMEYKGFDFSANLNTVQGVIKDNPFLYGFTEGGSLRGIKNGIKQDYWTPENPEGDFPRPKESDDPTNLITKGLQDASFIRLQNITLGYNVSKSTLESLKLSTLRFYITGSNLLTFTDFQSYSPEQEPSQYPEAVTMVAGLKLSF